eukprot:jgi/Ulvmu1/1438/UM011_0168.1
MYATANMMHVIPEGLSVGLPASRPRRSSTVSRAFLPDAIHIHDLHTHLLTLADVDPASLATAVQATATEAVAQPGGGGPFDWLAKAFETSLTAIDGGLEKLNIPYSYGFSIIILTFLVKVATFPLTKKQVASTLAVQALAPSIKELQNKYANDTERLQLETAKLYKEANVNPLAGCLPTLATIPVFIGLYRALTLAAQDGLLQEGFFFIPSLGGPATIEQQLAGEGLNWLVPFVNGAPPIGWEDTAKYLVLPVLLVLSQYASLQISSPPNSDDPSVQQTQAILKYLPILIGYFSLNVPAGLTIYWLTNNILTTGQQVYLKKVTRVDVPAPRGTVVNPVIDITPDASAADGGAASGKSRRSRKGETFRARQANEKASTIAKNARGKRKGSKFAERKESEVGAPAAEASAEAPSTAEKKAEATGTGSSNSA